MVNNLVSIVSNVDFDYAKDKVDGKSTTDYVFTITNDPIN